MQYWGMVGYRGSPPTPPVAYDLGGLRAGTYRLGFQDPSGEHFGEYFDNVDGRFEAGHGHHRR